MKAFDCTGALMKTGFGRLAVTAGLAGSLFCAVVAQSFAGQSYKPQRIVSLNLCTDQILMDLVERERIAGVSYLATDRTMSAKASEAERHRLLRGRAEEVLGLDPDLILVGEFSTPSLVSLLERLGRRVVRVAEPTSFDGIRGVIRQVAQAAGETQRGEAVVREFDRELAAARSRVEGSRPMAMALEVNNIISARNTLLDEILDAAGFQNMAGQVQQSASGRVALETLVTEPPDLLVLAQRTEDFPTVLADNLRHPIVAHLRARRASVVLPMSSYLCGTPNVVKAVESLANARHTVRQQQAWRRNRTP